MIHSLLTHPARRWWAALLLIVVLAAVFRVVGYNFSLPYVDHADEPAFYLTAREWRGLFDNQGYLNGYPPLYIWLNIAVQLPMEALGVTSMSATIGVLRLVSGIFSLLTTVLIALTARATLPSNSIAGAVAGLIAATAWAVSPLVVENAIYAIPDPMLYFLVSLALYLAVSALHNRPILAVWSVIVGGLAILDKYFTLTAILPGLMVALSIWRTDRQRGRRLLMMIAPTLLIIGGIAAAGVFMLPREAATARSDGLSNILNAARVLNNIYHAILPITPFAFALTVVLAALAVVTARRRGLPHVSLSALTLCALLIVTIPWLAATFSEVSYFQRMRDVLPATTAGCVVFGAAVGQIMLTLRHWTPMTVSRVMSGIPVVFLVAFVFVPQAIASLAIVQNRLLPDTRVDLRLWADHDLDPGTFLVTEENHKTFNPFWGGIEGQRWFDWWVSNEWETLTPTEWREQHGISYAVIEHHVWDDLASQAWRDETLLLRAFDTPSRWAKFVVVRLWRPQQELDVRFANTIRLVGVDVPESNATAGETLTFRFYWRADSLPLEDYSLFLHLAPANDSAPVAQADGAPAFPERPTYTWNDSTETLISAPFNLALPADLPAGTYHIRIGLYNYQTLARLPITESSGASLGDTFDLMQIIVR